MCDLNDNSDESVDDEPTYHRGRDPTSNASFSQNSTAISTDSPSISGTSSIGSTINSAVP